MLSKYLTVFIDGSKVCRVRSGSSNVAGFSTSLLVIDHGLDQVFTVRMARMKYASTMHYHLHEQERRCELVKILDPDRAPENIQGIHPTRQGGNRHYRNQRPDCSSLVLGLV